MKTGYGEIKQKNISWMDTECGRIKLNENTSFRDIPEIMEQKIKIYPIIRK